MTSPPAPHDFPHGPAGKIWRLPSHLRQLAAGVGAAEERC
jgi:hypothetical protein